MSTKENIDKLISWYEQNNPSAGQLIQVRGTRDTIAKFATLCSDGSYMYRGRTIVPLRKSSKEIRAEEARLAAQVSRPSH